MKKRLTHASLFSGIGGFDLAAEWLNWDNIFAVEYDINCLKNLRNNFPELILYRDIRKFNGEKYSGAVDVISGGFPCQPFSQAGKQRGSQDDRYLWPEMFRVIKEIKPSWIVGENVPGILSMGKFDQELPVDDKGNPIGNSGDLFYRKGSSILGSEILEALKEEGYETQTFIIPASAVRGIHKRDRVWIIGYSETFFKRNSKRANNVTNSKSRRCNWRRTTDNGKVSRGEICEDEQNHGNEIWSKTTSSSSSPTNSIDNGSSNRSQVTERTFRESEKRRMFESKGEDSNVKYSNFDGCFASTKHQVSRKTIPEESTGENKSFKIKQASRLSESENHVPNPYLRRDRRHQREGIEQRSAPCCDSSPNERKRFRISYPVSKPTVCRTNDGLSYQLDNNLNISPSQRKHSLQAMGNSVVPQLVYELFRFIDLTSKM